MKNNRTYASFFATVTELQSIENVFAGVEHSQMIAASACYPTANLSKKIAELQESLKRSSIGQTDNSNDYQIEINLLDDLDSWRKSLLERDQTFTAFDLRSYCSNLYPQFDNSVYADLAGFYRLLPPSATVLSKFDFVITQFFSRQLDNNRRAVRFESKKIIEELNLFNDKWTGSSLDTKPIKDQIRQSLQTLAKLSAQAKSHKTLQSWIENEFFDYSREVKRSLSETFFVPEVTTGIIICNLVVGNHFASLCESDNAAVVESFTALEEKKPAAISIPPKPPSETLMRQSHDNNPAEAVKAEGLSPIVNSTGEELMNEDALNKFSESNGKSANNNEAITTDSVEVIENPVNSVLLEVSENFSDLENAGILDFEKNSAVLSNNTDKTDLIDKPATNAQEVSEIKNETRVSDKTTKNTNLKIAAVLAQLSNECPDRELIKDYLRQSVTTQIRDLNIDQLLDAEDQSSESNNIVEAIRLIVRAEEATRVITSAEGSLSRKFQDEVARLLEEIQAASNILRRIMSETVSARGEDEPPQKYFETMLYATNTLVEVQLRLNSALVRWQNKEEIRLSARNQKVTPKNISSEESVVNAPVYETVQQMPLQINSIGKGAPNKWLMIGGIAMVLLGFAWFAFYPKSSATSVTATNVQSLDPKLMIGGANLTKVRVSKNTLFGFVNNEWGAQASQQKKDNLRLLLEEGSKYGYNNVLLINQNGDLVGNATPAEITLR